MTALLLAGFGLAFQAPCATIDQHDEGWALASLPGGTLTYLPVPNIDGLSWEGVRICPSGLHPPRRIARRPYPVLPVHTTLEELSR